MRSPEVSPSGVFSAALIALKKHIRRNPDKQKQPRKADIFGSIVTIWSEDDQCFLSRCIAMPELVTHGNTVIEARTEMICLVSGVLSDLKDPRERYEATKKLIIGCTNG